MVWLGPSGKHQLDVAQEAVAAQQKEPRKIVMDVYTKWCGPCKMMMANTFTNASVIEYINSNYYAVKFDAESPDPVTFQGNEFKNPTYDPNRRGRNGVHELSRALKVNAYPTLVYFDEDANVIAPISGYKQPAQMELYLKFFNEAWRAGFGQAAWESYRDNLPLARRAVLARRPTRLTAALYLWAPEPGLTFNADRHNETAHQPRLDE